MEAAKGIETLQSLVGIEGPVFIRKLTRKSHWGDDSVQEDRLGPALSNMFDASDSTFSFYRVETVTQLAQVAIGLNSKRGSLREQIDFVPFTEAEISGLRLVQNKGETECDAANKLHVDVVAGIQELSAMCEMAMKNKRLAGRLSKNWIAGKLNEPQLSNCHAITKTKTSCICV